MKQYLVGIDAGTTGCKTCVFDLEGNVIGADYREYPCYYPQPGWVEQKAEDMTPSLFDSCKAAIVDSKVEPENIIAMAISTQGSVFGPLGEGNELLRPFIGWQDARGVSYVDNFRNGNYMDPDEYYRISGYPIATVPCLTKYLWFKDNEPDIFGKTKRISHHQDFFLKEFGADEYFVNDTATASRTGAFDIDKKDWSDEILDAIGFDKSMFPKIVEAGKAVGKISHDISLQTGLAEGTIICVGAMDQNCSTLGGGLVEEGCAISVIGTYGAVYVAIDESMRDPNKTLIFKNNSGPGNYTFEAASVASASSYRWYRDTLCKFESIISDELRIDTYDLIDDGVKNAPVGANNLVFLPYLQGAGSGPRNDPFAKGCLLGLTLGTTKNEIARAIMEGITLEMRDNMESLKKMGIKISELRIVGGATKSRMWNQMQADMYKIPVSVLAASETGCLGAALYAGLGAGVYKDFKEATKRAVRIKEVFEPNPDNYAAYDKSYDRFVNGYEALNDANYFRKFN